MYKQANKETFKVQAVNWQSRDGKVTCKCGDKLTVFPGRGWLPSQVGCKSCKTLSSLRQFDLSLIFAVTTI